MKLEINENAEHFKDMFAFPEERLSELYKRLAQATDEYWKEGSSEYKFLPTVLKGLSEFAETPEELFFFGIIFIDAYHGSNGFNYAVMAQQMLEKGL